MKLSAIKALSIASGGLLLAIVGLVVVACAWPVRQGWDADAAAPRALGDPDRVRQVLRAGKTYVTRTAGSLRVRGEDKDWGLKQVVTINYAFEAQVDREIERNDGLTVVEVRHFRAVRSLKVDTELEDLRIDLGVAGDVLVAGLGILAPLAPDVAIPAAGLVKALDGVSAKSLFTALRWAGVAPERLAGIDAAAVKAFVRYDGLTGKAVRLTYRDGAGVLTVEPVRGELTEADRDFHLASAVLSDAFIVPDETVSVGRQWTVDGRNFANLIDPGLRARTTGDVTMERAAASADGRRHVRVVGGAIGLDASDGRAGRLGQFRPTGSLYYAPGEPYITEARLSGQAKLEQFSKDHLLFEARRLTAPTLDVVYTCRMIDTPRSR